MFFCNEKNAAVSCPISALMEIIREDLDLGICCDIDFIYQGKKHRTGAWGEEGETRKNVKYYLDNEEFDSLDELAQCILPDGFCLSSLTELVTVFTCDGCYPRSIPLLESYYKN